MNLNRLYEILQLTTVQLRKGAEIERSKAGPVDVVEVFAMPPADDPASAHLEKVDLSFIIVGVDRAKAEQHRTELAELLADYPNAELKGGPSYIHVGATIGDQGAALQLFALGKVLGFWKLITPESMGLPRSAAGRGYLWITPFRKSGGANGQAVGVS